VCSVTFGALLRVQNFLMFNRPLLGKWFWRYAYEREVLWRLVVDVKYGSLWGVVL
jgi:hypothetical protein